MLPEHRAMMADLYHLFEAYEEAPAYNSPGFNHYWIGLASSGKAIVEKYAYEQPITSLVFGLMEGLEETHRQKLRKEPACPST